MRNLIAVFALIAVGALVAMPAKAQTIPLPEGIAAIVPTPIPLFTPTPSPANIYKPLPGGDIYDPEKPPCIYWPLIAELKADKETR